MGIPDLIRNLSLLKIKSHKRTSKIEVFGDFNCTVNIGSAVDDRGEKLTDGIKYSSLRDKN